MRATLLYLQQICMRRRDVMRPTHFGTMAHQRPRAIATGELVVEQRARDFVAADARERYGGINDESIICLFA